MDKKNLKVRKSERNYRALWPRGRKVGQIKALAPRLSSLNGKTICELWDGLFRGDEIFRALREALSRRYPDLNIIPWDAFPKDGDHGFPNWEAYPRILAEKGCDAVIVATGA